MTIIKHRGIRGLVGTLCGACIVTLVALGFGAAPARAQSTPTCVAFDFAGQPPFIFNPAQQNSSVTLSVTVTKVASLSSSCINFSPPGTDVTTGSFTLFASVDSNNVQTSCAAGTAIKQISTVPNFGGPGFFPDTSTVGTFGYEVAYSGDPSFFHLDPSVSPCVDFVVTASPCPVSIGVNLAGGNGMPLAGTTDQWSVTLSVHACQDVTALKVQGGTPGWETNTTILGAPNPTVGMATVKNNNKNQVITWTMTELFQDQDAFLNFLIDATIKPKITRELYSTC